MKFGKWFSIEVRKWIFNVAIAVGAVLVFYGIITAEEAVVWSGVLTAALVVARVNTGFAGVEPRNVDNGGDPV